MLWRLVLMPYDDLPILPFQSSAAWEAWLVENHERTQGIWIKIAKKASGIATITFAEAIEVALCFGWIDGQRRSHDDVWFLQRFTPRRPGSRWSQINREKVEALTGRGLMRPSGLLEVERAQADGRWDAAYPSPSKMEVPEDLRRALDADQRAADGFAALNAGERYAILYRLHHTNRPATRAASLGKVIASLRSGETPDAPTPH